MDSRCLPCCRRFLFDRALPELRPAKTAASCLVSWTDPQKSAYQNKIRPPACVSRRGAPSKPHLSLPCKAPLCRQPRTCAPGCLHCAPFSLLSRRLRKLYAGLSALLHARDSPIPIPAGGSGAVSLRPPLDTLQELRMIDPSVAKIAFIVPFGTAVLAMLWILWNLLKQDKN